MTPPFLSSQDLYARAYEFLIGGNPVAAIEACKKALELAPNDADGLFNLGLSYAAAGRWEEAEATYLSCLFLSPTHARALQNLPLAIQYQGRSEQAIVAAKQAVCLVPDNPWAYFNLADMLLAASRPIEAESVLSELEEISPDWGEAKIARSIALALQLRIEEAYALQDSVRRDTPEAFAKYQSPLIMDAMYGRSNPDPLRLALTSLYERVHDFDAQASAEMASLLERVIEREVSWPIPDTPEFPYLSLLLDVSAETRVSVARASSSAVLNKAGKPYLVRPPRTQPVDGKLRIAYVSPNLENHPIAWLMDGIFRCHDHSRFAVHAYSVGKPISKERKNELKEHFDRFVDASTMSDIALAQHMLHAGIDVVIDLAGYTLMGRPGLLALRPAPVQIQYLGFLGSMGASFVDYAILDKYVMTDAQRPYWDESIIYLPHTAVPCGEHDDHIPDCRLSAQDHGVAGFELVLGGLSMPRKVDPATLKCWMQILLELPGAVLWLVCENEKQKAAVLELAVSQGVATDRIIIAAPADRDTHLDRYRHCLVSLDTFGFNGHTTVIDAIAMGTPVVTLKGAAVSARGASSILEAHGLGELVASTEEEYKCLVKRLANEPEYAKQVRAKVADRRSSNLFAPRSRARELESAYRLAYDRYRKGMPPGDICIDPLK